MQVTYNRRDTRCKLNTNLTPVNHPSSSSPQCTEQVHPMGKNPFTVYT
jgi:hypothetical protein